MKRALRLSTAEGMAYGVFVGLGERYIIAYAVALGTSSFGIGVLSALPGFLASLAQLWDAEAVRLLRSRKTVITTFALFQGLMLLPMLALAFLPIHGRAWWLVFGATLYSVSGALVSPAWGSLMAQVVPDSLRGQYFSLRGRLSTVATTVTFLAGGVFLNLLVQSALWGFAALFGVALLARLASWLFLKTLHEIPAREDLGVSAKAEKTARNSPPGHL